MPGKDLKNLPNEQMYDARQAAAYLHLSVTTIFRRAANGELRSARLGWGPKGTLRFKKEWLDQFVAEHERQQISVAAMLARKAKKKSS